MAKSAWEKAIEKQNRDAKRMAEKQQREAKRLAEKEARVHTAATIVNGRPMVGGMRIMDPSAEEILGCILAVYDGNENRKYQGNDSILPASYSTSLSLEFEKLKQYGMISDYCVWISAMWEVTLTPQALTYFDDKEIAIKKEDTMQKSSVSIGSIGSIVANGSNLIFGDVVNSNLSIDNSVQQIENEIKEKGGEDAEALQAILDEVKELIENMQESRHIPKNKGLFARISSHLEKHGWFYAEIVGLLGTAAIGLIQG